MKLEFRKWLEHTDDPTFLDNDPERPVFWLFAKYPYVDGDGFTRSAPKKIGDRRGRPFASLEDAAQAFEDKLRSDPRMSHLSIAPYEGKWPITYGPIYRKSAEFVWNERPSGPRDESPLEQTISKWDAIRPGGSGQYGTGANRRPPRPRLGELEDSEERRRNGTATGLGDSTPADHTSEMPATEDDPNRTGFHPGSHGQQVA